MASATTSKKMWEQATCSICLQLMAEKVVISCGHSYCQACLLSFMGPASSALSQQDTETFSCPQCRAPFQRGSLRPSKQLGSLIAALRELELEQEQEHEQEHDQKQEQKEEQELFCQEHGERLDLFCEDEGLLICWRCERDPRHKGHTTSLVEDAGPSYREKLQEAVRNLRQLEEECASQKAFTAKQLAEWNDVKGALSRSQAVQLETPEVLSLEVQTECEVTELYFDPMERLRSHQVGVTLDPETAHPELILSKDQRQVTRGGCPQGAGDPSPQRFTVSPCILGRQSFTSGRQYFEVDVGEGVGWDVGVCLESVQRFVETLQKPEAGFWALRLCARDGYQALTWPRTTLGLEEPPLVVGVLVDCEVGVVSFYNATSGSHLFTFPRASFPSVLRPYFQVSPYSPLFLPSPDE
uniref:Tripartite motif containing 38 n=1 Tax=Pipistrellus kuhlii TaxID=59472 RepID=A0A7J7TWU8_PIPKU|nr:tripartite motif containing 38 [Pipistrellus kuhlii]